jgi:benzodiazapine receptor
MQKTTRAKLNVVEFISLRMGFSIYTGWVTAATILNATFFLKSVGVKGASAGFSESTWTCIILYVALIVYVLASFMERNPLYGAVYIWVVVAIRNRQVTFPDIQSNSMIVLILIIVHVVLLNVLSIYEKMKGKATKGLYF